MSQPRDFATRAGEGMVKGVLSVRPYSVVVTIAEVFLRRNMGERYFNGRVFFGAFIFLVCLRAFFAYIRTSSVVFERLIMHSTFMDGFIILYVLLSFYHFITQRLKRRKLTIDHSFFLGESRLFFVLKIMGVGNYRVFTYRFIEPIFLFLLALPTAIFFSFVAACFVAYGAIRIGWNNATVLAEEWRRILDVLDSMHDARHVETEIDRRDAKERRTKPVRSSAKPKKSVPKRQDRVNRNEHPDLDLDTIRKRLDPRFRDPTP